jgi:hypothetical protein
MHHLEIAVDRADRLREGPLSRCIEETSVLRS